jgi:hypothetical protein
VKRWTKPEALVALRKELRSAVSSRSPRLAATERGTDEKTYVTADGWHRGRRTDGNRARDPERRCEDRTLQRLGTAGLFVQLWRRQIVVADLSDRFGIAPCSLKNGELALHGATLAFFMHRHLERETLGG